jgi:'Cold-shock' DNA-binding domain
MTGGTAQRMAADQAQTDVVAALTAICIDQSKRDPQLAERVALLKAASSKDVFVHATALQRAGMRGLAEGQKVSFAKAEDRRSGKR